MRQVFLIGVPKQLRRRIESALEGRGISPSTIITDLDRVGRLQLMPKPEVAVTLLRQYYEPLEGGFENAEVYVLPYVPIPGDIETELEAMVDMGARVYDFEMEVDGWPYLHSPRPKVTEPFLDALFDALMCALVDEVAPEPPLSQHVSKAVASSPRLVLIGDAIALCDELPDYRHGFVTTAMEAFVELVAGNGCGVGLDEFFKTRNLHFAKTGGIQTKLEISVNSKVIRDEVHHIHLKSGDRTSPQAAARIYFQMLTHEQLLWIFLLYVGPHPDTNITRKIDLAIAPA
jgi:hypothetical protein